MIIDVSSSQGTYEIVFERGSLDKVKDYCDLDRKVVIITDEGVPVKYIETLKPQCESSIVITLKQGEGSKSFET